MAKITIYVSDRLKARMDAVEGVNWSPLACRAFEAKLAEIITVKGVKDMRDVVTRLRASKSKTTDKARLRGREAGKAWASVQAEAVELERLQAWTEMEFGATPWREWLLSPGEDKDYEAEDSLDNIRLHAFYHATLRADGQRSWGHGAMDHDSAIDSGSFQAGFVEGALTVWEDVKDQL